MIELREYITDDGGDKSTQNKDIEQARVYLDDYMRKIK